MQVTIIVVIAFCCLILGINKVIANENSFIVTNQELTYFISKGHSQSKTLIIHGLIDGTEIKLLASDLNDKNSDNAIPSANIDFNGEPKEFSININKGESRNITVNVYAQNQGLFYGSIILVSANNTEKIPVTVDTKPLLIEAAVLTVVGILISIFIWSLYTYFALSSRFNKVKETIMDMDKILIQLESQSLIKNYDACLTVLLMHLDVVVGKMEHSDIDAVEEKMEDANEMYEQMTSVDNFVEAELESTAQGLQMSVPAYIELLSLKGEELKSKKVARIPVGTPLSNIIAQLSGNQFKFSVWEYLSWEKIKHNLIFTISATVLGIIASLSTLLQQDYVSGLRVLESWDYLILIGIGFGIDNVKQIVDKFLSRSTS